jgi:WXXGXW repeat (2 copies)
MKTHTTQWIMMAMGILFAGTVIAQGKRQQDDCDEKGRGGKGYYERSDDRHNDRHHNRYNDRNDRNNRYDYPVARHKPNAPYNDYRGQRPSPRHIWMPAEYRWRNGGYIYQSGYWIMPPRPGMQYVPGYWQPARNGGFVWISGFWSGGGFGARW